jgi:hypothetical protein
MGKKKNILTAGHLPALRIGTRVRCTDDGIEGRITWANAVAVKVRWDDGEVITWKRDSLATRPIEFLDAEQAQPTEQPAVASAPDQPVTAATAPVLQEETTPTAEQQAAGRAVDTPATSQTSPGGSKEIGSGEPRSTALPGGFAIPKRPRRAKVTGQALAKKLSALDAAVRVLAETGQPLSCKELIARMAAQGYWTSPGGRTPEATLCSALLREIAVKGAQSRFVKTGPGRFALRSSVTAGA